MLILKKNNSDCCGHPLIIKNNIFHTKASQEHSNTMVRAKYIYIKEK